MNLQVVDQRGVFISVIRPPRRRLRDGLTGEADFLPPLRVARDRSFFDGLTGDVQFPVEVEAILKHGLKKRGGAHAFLRVVLKYHRQKDRYSVQALLRFSFRQAAFTRMSQRKQRFLKNLARYYKLV